MSVPGFAAEATISQTPIYYSLSELWLSDKKKNLVVPSADTGDCVPVCILVCTGSGEERVCDWFCYYNCTRMFGGRFAVQFSRFQS